MVARRESGVRSPGASPRASPRVSESMNHEDDVRFWRERAIRLAESSEAGTSGANIKGRRPGAAAAALDALFRPRAADDRGVEGRPSDTSGRDSSHRHKLGTDGRPKSDVSASVKKHRAETHAAVASLHAVAADLTERAEAVDTELDMLNKRKVETHSKQTQALDERAQRAVAPLIARRDYIERLIENVESILKRTEGEDFEDLDDTLTQFVQQEAARARRARDVIAKESDQQNARARQLFEVTNENVPRDESKKKKENGVRFGKLPLMRRSYSPPRRRRSVSLDGRHYEYDDLSLKDINPPWDKRIAVETSRDDRAREQRSRSPSRSRSNSRGRGRSRERSGISDDTTGAFTQDNVRPYKHTRGHSHNREHTQNADTLSAEADTLETSARQLAEVAAEVRARATVAAGSVPWYQGDVHPRTVFRRDAQQHDFTAALWPDFDAYGGSVGGIGGYNSGMANGANSSSTRVEQLRDGYQTALLEMQRRRAVEREAAAAAAEAAAFELEKQRTQLAAIASRLARAVGVPMAPQNWGGSISKEADAAKYAVEAERFGNSGPAVVAANAAAETSQRDRKARRERAFDDMQYKEGNQSYQSSTAHAMGELAEIARVTGERMRAEQARGASEKKSGDMQTAHEAVSCAARQAAAAAAASAEGGSPLVITTALAEMACALKRAEAAASNVETEARRDESRLHRAEAIAAGTSDALEGEVMQTLGEFTELLDQLRVVRDRVESGDDAATLLDAPIRKQSDAIILEKVLRKADAESSNDATASLAAAAIRGSFEGRLYGNQSEIPRRSAATSPNHKRRQLGDRVPPDPKRASSIGYHGPKNFGNSEGTNDNNSDPLEVVGPVAFALNKFGTLTFVG